MVNKYGADRAWPFADGGGATILAVSIPLLLSLAGWFFFPSWWTTILMVLFLSLWLLILYFFRDPNREVVDQPGQVVSPGDGTVMAIVEEVEENYLEQKTIRISIFLSVFDVHVQRVPLGGRISLVKHKPGKFLQAFRPEASQVNEYIAMRIDSAYGPVLVKQIAGILARRCVNKKEVGEECRTGERFGLIRFGSRVDLFLPPQAEIVVNIGDVVFGGLTPLARLDKGGPDE